MQSGALAEAVTIEREREYGAKAPPAVSAAMPTFEADGNKVVI
ncbi:MAG: hypothetical protein ACR2NZ_17765 [Rubripirellula sp.]